MSKQKTILEWLEMLPDGYREICKFNYNPIFSSNKTPERLRDAINSLCNWYDTTINRDFFNDLWGSINLDNSINYEKLPTLPKNWQDLYKYKLPEVTQEIKKPKNPNKKRNKLAVKIFLAWAANPKAINGSQTFDTALEMANQIIKKLNS